MNRTSLVAPVVAILAAAACDAPRESGAALVVDTLENGAVAVRYARDVAELGRVLDATELLRIGAAEGDTARVFGSIRDVALGDDGRVYVLDGTARELRVFDDAGAHVRTVGREGGGPGEFRSPRGMRWHPSGTLWIADFGSQRYTELTPDGELVATYARLVSPAGVNWEGGFDGAGFLYDAGWRTTPGGTRERIYVRFRVGAGELAPLDTFPLPADAQPSYVVPFEAGLLSLPVPFTPRPSWAFDGRALWLGSAERYALVKRALAGDTLMLVETPYAPSPVTAEERARARQDIEETLARAGASAGPIDFSLVPATQPAHGRLRVDDAGRLWIARAPSSSHSGAAGMARFDVFETDGRYLGDVALDIDAERPLAFAAGRVAGVRRDEMDVEYVVVYELRL